MKTAREFLKESSLNGYVAGDYTPLEVYELMEDYAEYYHEQKLLQHSVSGKTEVCPDCRTQNLHHMGHGAWVCAFCGNNGKPMACASGAVATVAARGISKHVCGAQGYNPMLGDTCEGCETERKSSKGQP